jgi:GrpB-like predicted nucleotidyltransferase (UPF0157 family)
MYKQLQILPYDPGWVVEFEAERDRIAHKLGDLAIRIVHNGSTAVPGGPAYLLEGAPSKLGLLG